MKRSITSVVCLLISILSLSTFAQNPFKQEWKAQFPIPVETRMINDDRSLVLGGNMNEIAMMDGVTGKIIWQLNFKEKLGQKKAKDWSWDKKVKVVWVDVKGEKKDQVVTSYFKDATGEQITEQQYKDLRSEFEKGIHWVKKGALIVDEHSTDVWLEYEPKKIVGSAGKGTKSKVNVNASGTFTWNTTIDAKYIRTLCTNAIPAAAKAFGGDFFRISYAQDKVFIIYEGMSVIDIKTGKLLWQTDLDNTDFDFGLFKSTQTLGRAGFPYADASGVYVADLSKGQYRIKKFDINTGNVLWQTEAFDKDDVVPSLQVINGVLVAQFGGRLQTQTYIPGVEGRPDVCKSEYKFAGNAGVKAYDVNTGKLLWETNGMKELGDKFSGAITNIVKVGEYACLASDKNFYVFESNGKVKFSTPIKTMKIGKPISIESYSKDVILLQCEEGVALVSVADSKVLFATNTGNCYDYQQIGNAFFVWTGKDQFDLSEFVRVDMTTGQIYGKAKDMSYPFFTSDGEYVIKLDGNKVIRFQTK